MQCHNQVGFHCAPSSLEPTFSFIFKELTNNFPTHLTGEPYFNPYFMDGDILDFVDPKVPVASPPPLGALFSTPAKTQLQRVLQLGYLLLCTMTTMQFLQSNSSSSTQESHLLRWRQWFLQRGGTASGTGQASLWLSSSNPTWKWYSARILHRFSNKASNPWITDHILIPCL